MREGKARRELVKFFLERLFWATVVGLALAAGRAYFNPEFAWSAWQIVVGVVSATILLTLEWHAKQRQRETLDTPTVRNPDFYPQIAYGNSIGGALRIGWARYREQHRANKDAQTGERGA